MRIALGTFARLGIEARFGADVEAVVEAALRHYARRSRSQRAPISVPPFRRPDLGIETDLELELSPGEEIETALEAEAAEQGVPLPLLCAHAVLVYLADIDATGAAASSGPQEGPAPERYQRGCNFIGTASRARPRRQVGSA